MGIGNRIRIGIGSKYLSLKDFCEDAGVSYRTLQHYLSEKRGVSADFLITLGEQVGVSASWVLTGRGSMFIVEDEQSVHTPSGLAEAGVEFATPEQLADFVSVPALDGQTSPGSVGHYALSRAWLNQQKLDPDALAVVLVTGDSMEPRLSDGDLAVINTADTDLRDGVTYAVQLGEEVITKRLQVLPLKHVKLCAINGEFEPIVVDLSAGELTLLGRVVASMHEW